MRKIPIEILVMTMCVFFGETSGCFSLTKLDNLLPQHSYHGKVIGVSESLPDRSLVEKG